MKSGKELGAAIDAARIKKGLTKKALADHFSVKPPSITDWIDRGTISKERLPDLWSLFADVVGPDHWGLDAYPWQQSAAAPVVTLGNWRKWADALAAELVRRNVLIDAGLFLDLVDTVAASQSGEAGQKEASAVFNRMWPLIKRGTTISA